MKLLAAILFLIIIVFNFCGYSLMISSMQSSSEAALEKKLDQNSYEESDLIAIKTKLNLPYYNGTKEYERAYGSININGKKYQYVKRRVHNDTLELLCLQNQLTTKLQSLCNELINSLAEQAPTPKKNNTVKISLPDFFQPIEICSTTCFLKRKQTFIQHVYFISEGYFSEQRKPPRHC